MKTFKCTCNKLNKILETRPENQSEFLNTINDIIYKEVFECNGGLYWNRELFIDCGLDDKLCRKMIYTNKVMFVPSDDLIEHPGITMTYKPEFRKTEL